MGWNPDWMDNEERAALRGEGSSIVSDPAMGGLDDVTAHRPLTVEMDPIVGNDLARSNTPAETAELSGAGEAASGAAPSMPLTPQPQRTLEYRAPALVTAAQATTPGDPSLAATNAGDVAYDAQQSPAAPTPPSSPSAGSPPPRVGVAGVSPMQRLNAAAGLTPPNPSIQRMDSRLAQVGNEKAAAPVDPEAAIADARRQDAGSSILGNAIRFMIGSAGGPNPYITAQEPGHAAEQAALGRYGRETAQTQRGQDMALKNQALDVQRGAQQRTTDTAEATHASQAALDDPASEESRRAQGVLRQFMPEMTDEQAAQWSAARVERVLPGALSQQRQDRRTTAEIGSRETSQEDRQAFQHDENAAGREQNQAQFDARMAEHLRQHPGSAAGGHGGGAARGGDLASAVADAASHGVRISESDARRLGPRGIRAVLQQAIGREGASSLIEQRAENRVAIHQSNEIQDMERANEILPGVHATIQMAGSEPAKLRAGYDSGRNAIGAFERLRGIAREFGPTAIISPEAAARVRAELIPLRHMVADLQGTGIINPSEVPVINAALADPTSLHTITFGTLNGAIDEWRRLSERGVRSTLANRGVVEAEQETAIQELFGGLGVEEARGRHRHQAAAAPLTHSAQGGPQRARLPDGRIITGPAGAALPPGAVPL